MARNDRTLNEDVGEIRHVHCKLGLDGLNPSDKCIEMIVCGDKTRRNPETINLTPDEAHKLGMKLIILSKLYYRLDWNREDF